VRILLFFLFSLLSLLSLLNDIILKTSFPVGIGTNGTTQEIGAGEYSKRHQHLDGGGEEGEGYLPHHEHVQHGHREEVPHSGVLGTKE
jgi:hypothetical protein